MFLPDCEQRSQLVLPPPAHVDYRAACFCHRNLIEIGYVCSVCLSSEFEFLKSLLLERAAVCFFFNQSVSFVFSILQLQPHLYDMRVSVSVLWSSVNTSTCVHSVHLFPYVFEHWLFQKYFCLCTTAQWIFISSEVQTVLFQGVQKKKYYTNCSAVMALFIYSPPL